MQIGDLLARASSDDEALAAVVGHMKADSGTIHLIGPDGMLHLAAATPGFPDIVLKTIGTIPVGKGMAGLAVEPACAGQCVQYPDRQEWRRVRTGAVATGMEGAIVVPIFRGEEVIRLARRRQSRRADLRGVGDRRPHRGGTSHRRQASRGAHGLGRRFVHGQLNTSHTHFAPRRQIRHPSPRSCSPSLSCRSCCSAPRCKARLDVRVDGRCTLRAVHRACGNAAARGGRGAAVSVHRDRGGARRHARSAARDCRDRARAHHRLRHRVDQRSADGSATISQSRNWARRNSPHICRACSRAMACRCSRSRGPCRCSPRRPSSLPACWD